jgi:hypothetical protein
MHPELEVDEDVERVVADRCGHIRDAPARTDEMAEVIDVRSDFAAERVDARVQVICEALEPGPIEARDPAPEIHPHRSDLENAEAKPSRMRRPATLVRGIGCRRSGRADIDRARDECRISLLQQLSSSP